MRRTPMELPEVRSAIAPTNVAKKQKRLKMREIYTTIGM
jgi:hypothetical protein